MVADLLAGVFFIAVVYVLVRPRSKGADLVNGFGQTLTAIVSSATDLAV
jgi:ABC-type sulfate transport system permease component